MEGKKAVLIGSAPLGTEEKYLVQLLTQPQDIIWIAVDGGIVFFAKHNRIPDYWIGDMDSADEKRIDKLYLGRIPAACVKRVSVEKDDTDTALAVAMATDAGCDEILLFGGMGGQRISHTIANIQLMHDYAQKGCHIQMLGEGTRMEVMGPGMKRFAADMTGHISVFALTDLAKAVRIKGMKYSYEGELTNRLALGVSNSFVGRESSIEFADGALLLIFEEKSKDN